MVETLIFALLIFLFLNRNKGRRKPRGLDSELKELIENSNDATGIATQFAFLAAAQINGIPTNVNAELTDSATPEDIVRIIVRP